MAAHTYNSEFLIGAVTAGPVMLVAYSAVAGVVLTLSWRFPTGAFTFARRVVWVAFTVGVLFALFGTACALVGLYRRTDALSTLTYWLIGLALGLFFVTSGFLGILERIRARQAHQLRGDESSAADSARTTWPGDTRPVECPPQRLPLSGDPDVTITAAVRASRVLPDTRREA